MLSRKSDNEEEVEVCNFVDGHVNAVQVVEVRKHLDVWDV